LNEVLRTPDHHFEELPGFTFEPHYLDIDWPALGKVRMHYVYQGDPTQPTILLLHGEPSWAYLYRKMIAALSTAGFRCIAPDLIGFGRSDKPAARTSYTYAAHLNALEQFLDCLKLDGLNLFCQDWGGLLGLRLVAAMPELFNTVCCSNTMLPDATTPPSEAFKKWREFSQSTPAFPVGGIIRGATVRPLDDDIEAAYNAPFPSEEFKAGARQFPLLVPMEEGAAEVENNRLAWRSLEKFSKPVLTLFADQDPVTAGGDKIIQQRIPGCAGQPHQTIVNAGHFVQEDAGEELAQHLIEWLPGTLCSRES